MALRVERFATTSTYAPFVYADASFLFDIYHATVPPPTGVGARPQLSHSFFGRATSNGSVFVASTLAIEELVHKLVIGTVEAAASLRGFVGWKLYQAGDKVHFDSDYARGLTKADSAVQSIGKAGILHLAIPTPLMPVREGDPRLTRYALALCRRGALGGMDAFHAAVARLAGIEWIASCDRDFVVVPTLSIYAP